MQFTHSRLKQVAPSDNKIKKKLYKLYSLTRNNRMASGVYNLFCIENRTAPYSLSRARFATCVNCAIIAV